MPIKTDLQLFVIRSSTEFQCTGATCGGTTHSGEWTRDRKRVPSVNIRDGHHGWPAWQEIELPGRHTSGHAWEAVSGLGWLQGKDSTWMWAAPPLCGLASSTEQPRGSEQRSSVHPSDCWLWMPCNGPPWLLHHDAPLHPRTERRQRPSVLKLHLFFRQQEVKRS